MEDLDSHFSQIIPKLIGQSHDLKEFYENLCENESEKNYDDMEIHTMKLQFES